jgi:hypothetical protein
MVLSSDSSDNAEQEEDLKIVIQNQEKLKSIFYKNVKQETHEHRIPFIIYPDNKFNQIWEVLNTICIIFSCFITPVSLAFSDDLSSNDSFTALMYFFDFFFLSDIIMNFITANKDENEKVIDDIKIISSQYIKSWFIIDLISIFPFDLIIQKINPDNAQINSFNKILRVLRIGKLYRLIRVVKQFQQNLDPNSIENRH